MTGKASYILIKRLDNEEGFLAYAIGFTNVSMQNLAEQVYLSLEGIFGSTLGVSASYVMLFVLFGAFMEKSGTGQLFMDFAMSITGHSAGGPGKVAVVSSSLFGTVSGSAVANVMVDGPITIPLMKRTGFRPPFAAAVESVASTGGQLMPPIMGAAAFVMAEFLAVPYAQITVWAILPAFLYYLAVFFAVHFEAKRYKLAGVPKSELPAFGGVMLARGHLFVPILVVLGGLLQGYSAPLCALWGALSCLPLALLRRATRAGISWKTVLEALEEGAKNYGVEGVTVTGSGADEIIWLAVQREWADDAKNSVKLLAYKPSEKSWGAVRYPLDATQEGWVGLSEITAVGDRVIIIERDNQIAEKAKLKKLYSVSLADMKPVALGGELPLVKKTTWVADSASPAGSPASTGSWRAAAANSSACSSGAGSRPSSRDACDKWSVRFWKRVSGFWIPSRASYDEQHRCHNGGPSTRSTTTIAAMLKSSTAPAETSLATFACSWNCGDSRSTRASTAVLIVSPTSTAPMVMARIAQSWRSKPNHTPTAVTTAATPT